MQKRAKKNEKILPLFEAAREGDFSKMPIFVKKIKFFEMLKTICTKNLNFHSQYLHILFFFRTFAHAKVSL